MMMTQAFIEDPPYIKNAVRRSIDYVGFGLMALWLATLQILLDKGQDDDWFSSSFITSLAIIAAVSLVAFVVWELRAKDPIVNLRVMTREPSSIHHCRFPSGSRSGCHSFAC